MAQKEIKYTFFIKRLVEQVSIDRFIFYQIIPFFCFALFFNLGACGAPEIKLDRAARRTVDTLVNHQLDSISPMLDSLCKTNRDDFIHHAVDSIMEERKKKEERLRLNDK